MLLLGVPIFIDFWRFRAPSDPLKSVKFIGGLFKNKVRPTVEKTRLGYPFGLHFGVVLGDFGRVLTKKGRPQKERVFGKVLANKRAAKVIFRKLPRKDVSFCGQQHCFPR